MSKNIIGDKTSEKKSWGKRIGQAVFSLFLGLAIMAALGAMNTQAVDFDNYILAFVLTGVVFGVFIVMIADIVYALVGRVTIHDRIFSNPTSKAIFWFLLIVGVAMALYIPQKWGEWTRYRGVQVGWTESDKRYLTNRCINDVTSLGLGYTQAQIKNYCTCNTNEVVKVYLSGDAFANDANNMQVYNDVSYNCEDKLP